MSPLLVFGGPVLQQREQRHDVKAGEEADQHDADDQAREPIEMNAAPRRRPATMPSAPTGTMPSSTLPPDRKPTSGLPRPMPSATMPTMTLVCASSQRGDCALAVHVHRGPHEGDDEGEKGDADDGEDQRPRAEQVRRCLPRAAGRG